MGKLLYKHKNAGDWETGTNGIKIKTPDGETLKIKLDNFGNLSFNFSNFDTTAMIRPTSGNTFDVHFLDNHELFRK